MKNGEVGVSVWEENQMDAEDSTTQVGCNDRKACFSLSVLTSDVVFWCCQVVALELKSGDQVYLELLSNQKLCTHLEYNMFTGYIVYPYTD